MSISEFDVTHCSVSDYPLSVVDRYYLKVTVCYITWHMSVFVFGPMSGVPAALPGPGLQPPPLPPRGQGGELWSHRHRSSGLPHPPHAPVLPSVSIFDFFLQIGDTGFIRSPNYPSPYPSDIKCVWWLKAKTGGRISMTCTDVVTQVALLLVSLHLLLFIYSFCCSSYSYCFSYSLCSSYSFPYSAPNIPSSAPTVPFSAPRIFLSVSVFCNSYSFSGSSCLCPP